MNSRMIQLERATRQLAQTRAAVAAAYRNSQSDPELARVLDAVAAAEGLLQRAVAASRRQRAALRIAKEPR